MIVWSNPDIKGKLWPFFCFLPSLLEAQGRMIAEYSEKIEKKYRIVYCECIYCIERDKLQNMDLGRPGVDPGSTRDHVIK